MLEAKWRWRSSGRVHLPHTQTQYGEPSCCPAAQTLNVVFAGVSMCVVTHVLNQPLLFPWSA